MNQRFTGPKKKIHRGRKKTKKIKFFYNNINGLTSKTGSLKAIIQSLLPDVVVLCKTKLSKATSGLLNNIFNKNQFKVFSKFTKAGKEEIVVAIRNNAFQSSLEVTSSNLNTIMSASCSTGNNKIRVMVGYAPQEDDDIEFREEFFQELELEITNCIAGGDIPFEVCDFNAKIVSSTTFPQGIPISDNRKLLWDIVNEQKMIILNYTNK